jgi:selenocysteine-specific elongation factor
MERGSPEEVLLVALARLEPCEAGQLARHTDLAADEAMAAATAVVASGRAVALSGSELGSSTLLFTAEGFARLTARAREILSSFHRQHPLRRSIAREELRSRLDLEARPFDALLTTWARRGDVRESAGSVALPDHEPHLSPAHQAAADAFLTALKANPYSPPTDRLPEPELLAYLEEEGRIVRVDEGIAFSREAYDEMTARIVEHLRAHGTVTLAQVRDMFATSRKYAQAFLEHLDDQRITRRVGDERVLRKGGADPP